MPVLDPVEKYKLAETRVPTLLFQFYQSRPLVKLKI